MSTTRASALSRVLAVMGLILLFGFGPPTVGAQEEDDEENRGVVIDGGTVASSTTIDVTADADAATSDAGGGDVNTALLDQGPLPVPADAVGVQDLEAAAGNGGAATSDGGGGEVAFVEPAEGGDADSVPTEAVDDGGFVPAPIETGSLGGNEVMIGDTSDGGYVEVVGPDVTYTGEIDLSADGGEAVANATGGDGNVAAFTCEGVDCSTVFIDGDGSVSGLAAEAGNGGAAVADASGGSVLTGGVGLGGNTGGVISVGDTAGDAAVLVDGGTFAVTTILAVSADGGSAVADANGGDDNVASFTCVGDECETIFVIGDDDGSASLSDVLAAAGNGGAAAALAVGGDATLGDLLGGGNTANAIMVGNTSGHGGLALVEILGGDVSVATDVSLTVDAGAAAASADGGDANVATFACAGFDCSAFVAVGAVGGTANLTGVRAAAGNGGVALADAGGGVVAAGTISGGDNTGNVVTVGDTAGGAGPDGGDALVSVTGGSVTVETVVSADANGGAATANADGGADNLAGFDCEGLVCTPLVAVGIAGDGTVSDIAAAAGNGGVAAAFATGGAIAIGDIASGSNAGNDIRIGDTTGGAGCCGHGGGDSTVQVDGGIADYDTLLEISANGGIAVANAAGGDGNVALVACTGDFCSGILALGIGTTATVSGVDVEAGNGGAALADASGGAIAVGDLLSGGNVGHVLSVGATTGGDAGADHDGGDALVTVAGGAVAVSTVVTLAVDAESATASANGGDDNLATIACAGLECAGLLAIGDGTIADVTVRAGNGGTATAVGGTADADADGGDVNVALLTCVGDGCVALLADDATLTGLTILSGNGGTADVFAPEGTITVGDLTTGDNTGNLIDIGDTTG